MASALQWVKSTFLYVRMQKSPAMYGLNWESDGCTLDEHSLADYILISLKRLESCALIKIGDGVADSVNHRSDDHNTWTIESTTFGRIASSYYLSHLTMHTWLGGIGDPAILSLLLASNEFKNITVRDDEVSHLQDLHSQMLLNRFIDFEFEASVHTKLMVLVSAYFCYLTPGVFSLCCDTDFIIDGLERMIGALREVFLFLKRYDSYRSLLFVERQVHRKTASKKQPPSLN